eukprot:SAG31_NODE_2462_length_5654_cov_465.384740_6_plen_66_part_00
MSVLLLFFLFLLLLLLFLLLLLLLGHNGVTLPSLHQLWMEISVAARYAMFKDLGTLFPWQVADTA